jgi:hypothetical protein
MLAYDPHTGEIRWRVSPARGVPAGALAGGSDLTRNYARIKIKGKKYNIHRIAYALYHGTDPYPHLIDHINRIKHCNEINNLRIATHTDNNKNRTPTPASPALLAHLNRIRNKPILITYPDGTTTTAPSITAAAQLLNTTRTHISKHLNKHYTKTHSGITYSYI